MRCQVEIPGLLTAIPILLDTLTEANNFSAVDESLRRFAELSKICQLDLVKLDDEIKSLLAAPAEIAARIF